MNPHATVQKIVETHVRVSDAEPMGVAVGVATAVSALVGADPKMSAFLGFVGFFCVGVTGEAIKYWRRRRRTRT